MAIVIHNQAALSGGWQTVKTVQVKNLGWLFKHASQVTELHFKQQPSGDYLLKAILNCGQMVFETTYADKSIFCDVFNRNRNLQGIVVYFDNDEWQAVGELGYQNYELRWAPSMSVIGTVYAKNARQARRLAPKPYRRYLGEICAEVAS